MPKLNMPNDERVLLFASAKGLVQALETLLQQNLKPTKQNLKDLRLALTALHKLGVTEDLMYYGELYQALVRSFEKDERSPRGANSEIVKNIEIAATSFREVIEKSLKGKLQSGEVQ